MMKLSPPVVVMTVIEQSFEMGPSTLNRCFYYGYISVIPDFPRNKPKLRCHKLGHIKKFCRDLKAGNEGQKESL